MTPEGLLDFVGRARKLDAATRNKAAAKAIERMALQEVLHRRIETLSKGFRRRVGLAQAILHDPDVLILDEPTDGLDPNQKHEVRELIRSMGDEKAIIISTHILEEVDAVCDRALIIDHGRIVGDGTPAQLHARSPDFNSVALKVQPAELDRALKVLRGLPIVKSVDAGPKGEGPRALIVRPKDGRFIADAVAQALSANKLTPIDVQARVGTLDDVFRRLTTGTTQ
jgi:ABC-2 type transport system ATP-binding protein